MMRLPFILIILLSITWSCNQPNTPSPVEQVLKKAPSPLLKLKDKQKAIDIIKGIQTNHNSPEIAFTKRFKHHIPNVDSSQAGFIKHLASLKRKKVTPVRFIEEHEYVITHCREEADTTNYISFLVFRFEDGHLAEYWENRQVEITKTKSGRSMIDGPVTPKDLDQTEYNKALIRRYFLDINYVGKMARLPELINSKQFHQHNPHLKDGLGHLSKEIKGKKRRPVAYCKLRLLLGQGDMVFTIWDYPEKDNLVVVHELWRIENNKIVEHWDVIQ